MKRKRIKLNLKIKFSILLILILINAKAFSQNVRVNDTLYIKNTSILINDSLLTGFFVNESGSIINNSYFEVNIPNSDNSFNCLHLEHLFIFYTLRF